MSGGIFDPENSFWTFIGKIFDVFVISLLWFVFSIPIITIGASTTALFQFTLKQADDEEGYVFKSFIKAFAKNFKEATILWLIILLVGAFLVFDLYVCMNFGLPPIVKNLCFVVISCLILLFLITTIYVFPILSRFKFGVKKIITNAFIMSVGNLFSTVTIIILYVLVAFLVYLFPPAVIFLFGLGTFFASYFYREVFRKYSINS